MTVAFDRGWAVPTRPTDRKLIYVLMIRAVKQVTAILHTGFTCYHLLAALQQAQQEHEQRESQTLGTPDSVNSIPLALKN